MLHRAAGPAARPHKRGKPMNMHKKRTIALYLAPAVTMVIVLLYVPILLNLYNSFFSWSAYSPEKVFLGLQNYVELFHDSVFWTAIRNNLVFLVMSLIFQIGVSLVISAVLEEKFMRRWQNFFRTVYFVPSLLMVTVVGIAFKMIYSPTLGLVNPLLTALGFDTSSLDLLGNQGSAIFAIAAMSQWQYIGYTVVLFIVAIQKISPDIFEAAELDGTNGVQKFFRITVPEISDTIIVNMIIIVTGSIRVFDEVYVTTGGGPGTSTETLATYLYRSGFTENHMGYASAIAFVIFIVTFALGLLQMKRYHLDEL